MAQQCLIEQLLFFKLLFIIQLRQKVFVIHTVNILKRFGKCDNMAWPAQQINRNRIKQKENGNHQNAKNAILDPRLSFSPHSQSLPPPSVPFRDYNLYFQYLPSFYFRQF
jgi:hypothetical protein